MSIPGNFQGQVGWSSEQPDHCSVCSAGEWLILFCLSFIYLLAKNFERPQCCYVMDWKQIMSSVNFFRNRTCVFPEAFLWEPKYGYQFKHTLNFMSYHRFPPPPPPGVRAKTVSFQFLIMEEFLLCSELILPNYYSHGRCAHYSMLLRFRSQCELTDFRGVILCLCRFCHISHSVYCLLMEQIFTENNTIIFLLAVNKVHITISQTDAYPLWWLSVLFSSFIYINHFH